MTTLDWHYKGLPLDLDELELADIGRQGWNVLRGDLPMPVMVLLRDPLARERARDGGLVRGARPRAGAARQVDDGAADLRASSSRPAPGG